MKKVINKYKSLLDEIDKNIVQTTASSNEIMKSAVLDLITGGGKRLRPLLMVMTACLGNFDRKKMIKLGAGLELLHMATLVHDDIIDEAKLRRSQRTAQQRFGKNIAVFMGDYLLSCAFNNFVRHLSRKSLIKLSKIVKLICEGEINQYQNKYNYNISICSYLKRIRRKTALLFGFSTFLGGYESGIRGKNLHHLYQTGLELGMAFQIQDDILDFTGEEENIGKNSGQDINAGIYTLPLIFLLQNDKYRQQTIAILDNEQLQENDMKTLLAMVKEEGIGRSKKLMKKFLHKSRYHLQSLPQGAATEDILILINSQLTRKY